MKQLHNSELIKQLKDNIWAVYGETKGGDWHNWFEGLSPIEQAAWKEKFDEVQEEYDKKRPE